MTLDPRGPMRSGQPLALSAAQLNWINQQMRGPGMGGGALGRDGSPLDTVVVTVANGTFDSFTAEFPAGVTFGVGSALDLTFGFGLDAAQLESSADRGDPPTTASAFEVDQFAKLDAISFQKRAMRITSNTMDYRHSEHWGVVRSLSRGTTTTTMDVIVGGLFSCLVYAFSTDRRVSGALPIPLAGATFPKTLWRPFPTLSPAGYGYVVAFGSWWRVSDAQWPRVYEALVRL